MKVSFRKNSQNRFGTSHTISQQSGFASKSKIQTCWINLGGLNLYLVRTPDILSKNFLLQPRIHSEEDMSCFSNDQVVRLGSQVSVFVLALDR